MMNSEIKKNLGFIFGRRSIRVFLPGEVSDEQVKTLLEAAMSAPSAVAKDPWRFVVVREKETLKKIADALPNGKMLPNAAVGIVVCGDIEAAHDKQLSYLLQDCAAAIENLLLAAHTLGLGTCWLGVHPRENRVKAIKEILGLPENIIPVSVVAVGKPGEVKEPQTRYKAEKVHYERW